MEMGHAKEPSIMGSMIEAQFCTKIRKAPDGTDLSGQVAIITGASTGLGYHSARHFLSLKLSHLIIGARSLKKAEVAVKKLRADYPKAKIEIWPLEMSDYSSIQTFCQKVETSLARLDIVILNAGITKMKFDIVESTGHEEVVQVNYISTFFLAILMLPILKQKRRPVGMPSRLTIVSSGVAWFAKLPNRDKRPFLASFDDVAIQSWDPSERYFASKTLGQLFFARMLKYLDPNDVIVNLVDPGLCKGSELHRTAEGAIAVFMSVSKALTGRTLDEGAWTYVDAAVVKGKESHGCFCADWQIRP
jgi:NAD(P)-dependent dehydrogenase (short-subunit alcohol dehydrogenase family)